MIAALRENKGLVYAAAKSLGCVAQTVYNYIQRHPEVAEAAENEKGILLDFAEAALFKNIKEGNQRAIEFLLLTQGKHRGYVIKSEFVGRVDHHVTTDERESLASRIARLAESFSPEERN